MIQEKASPKISVIVPVYNPGDGFARCLKSLQEQTLTDIELIFIDDCGNDGSMELIRKAALTDKRIRILVNEQNSGAGYSRNRGIEEACGEYLAFIDPDDYISGDFLELLYNKTKQNNPDIVKGEREHVNLSGKVIDCSKEQALNETIRKGLNKGKPLFRLFTYNHWTAIYNRSFLLRIGARYGLTRNSQDSTFLLRTCYYTKSIDFADSAKYYYVVRTDSRVRDYSRDRLRQELLAFEDAVDFFCEHETDGNFYAYIIGRLEYLLRIQAWINLYYSKTDGKWFLNEIRYAAKSLPNPDLVCFMSFKMKGLIKYGVNLSTVPYRMQGEETSIEDRVDTAKRWTDFLCRYPEYMKDGKYIHQIIKIYEELLDDVRVRKINFFQRKKLYKTIRIQLQRLTRINGHEFEKTGEFLFLQTKFSAYQMGARFRACIYKLRTFINKAGCYW